MELADTPDLGSGAVRFGGSSPPSRIPLFIQGIAAVVACLLTACSIGGSIAGPSFPSCLVRQ